MKRIIPYIAMALGLYVVFLLVSFPADRAYSLFKDKLTNVQVYGVSGTVWSAKSEAVVVDKQTFRDVKLSLRPWMLVLGRIEANVSFDNNASWATGYVGKSLFSGDVLLSNMSGQWAAAELQAFLPSMPANLGGSLRFDFEEVVYEPEERLLKAAVGHADWLDASVTLLREATIGDYQVDFTTTDTGVNAVFSDVNDGPLTVQGSASLSPDKKYQVDARLKVRDQHRQDLTQSMRFLGKQDGQGNYVFNKSGDL